MKLVGLTMYFMLEIRKDDSCDFVILNLTDIHASDSDCNEKNGNYRITKYTIDKLYERVNPDLVTISGDLAWSNNFVAYKELAMWLDSYKKPWSVVWGNHDNERGRESLDKVIEIYTQQQYFFYENGPDSLGRGNYVINIKNNEQICESLIMMDTHDREKYVDSEGKEKDGWGKLSGEQIKWYEEQIKELKKAGSKESIIITHIPIYAYKTAFKEAINDDINDTRSVLIEDSYSGKCWKDGYKDSFGVKREDVCCFPIDDGFFDVITKNDHTKNIIAGHDHVSNYSIRYKGVRLTYGLKTGSWGYWEPNTKPALNGGTVMMINNGGVFDVHHEYVDVSNII